MKKNQLRLNETLSALVDEYITSSEPVSSRILNERYLSEVSSATLRLDLMKLEEMNLISQPHTSAGRIPTISGYRAYLKHIEPSHEQVSYPRMDNLRELLIHNYKDTPRALHYIMQVLAKETDQLSFVAEPEVSSGYLAKLDVFPIGDRKFIFVMSLDSGLDKTVIMKCDNDLTEQQLRKLVRYLNDELVGLRIYDIANRVLLEMKEHVENTLVGQFLDGAVTGPKIANGSLTKTHLSPEILTLSKLEHEIQDQTKGVGDTTQNSPANLFDDKTISHVLDKEYQELPHIILNNQCDAFLYIIDAKIEGNMVTVTIGISQVYTASEPFYTLIALAK